MQVRKLIFGLSGGLVAGVAALYIGSGLTPTRTSDRHVGIPQGRGDDKLHETKALVEALKKKPDHTPVLLRLAQLSQEAGDGAEAIRHLKIILANEPDNAEARLELGRALFLAGDAEAAIAETRRILDRHAGHAEALFNLGAIYANLNDAAQAVRYWKRLLAAAPQAGVARTAKKMMLQLQNEGRSGS